MRSETVLTWDRIGYDRTQRLHKDGLSRCKDFHHDIEFYKHNHQRPPLEPTWRILMLVLFTYLGRESSKDALTIYQSEHLGRANDETALLELFGLPVKDLKAGLAQRGTNFSQGLIENIHQERISVLSKSWPRMDPSLS